jgi:hypothetical protein
MKGLQKLQEGLKKRDWKFYVTIAPLVWIVSYVLKLYILHWEIHVIPLFSLFSGISASSIFYTIDLLYFSYPETTKIKTFMGYIIGILLCTILSLSTLLGDVKYFLGYKFGIYLFILNICLIGLTIFSYYYRALRPRTSRGKLYEYMEWWHYPAIFLILWAFLALAALFPLFLSRSLSSVWLVRIFFLSSFFSISILSVIYIINLIFYKSEIKRLLTMRVFVGYIIGILLCTILSLSSIILLKESVKALIPDCMHPIFLAVGLIMITTFLFLIRRRQVMQRV